MFRFITLILSFVVYIFKVESVPVVTATIFLRLENSNVIILNESGNQQLSATFEADKEGWGYLEVEGNDTNSFLDERFLAGFAEGVITCNQLLLSYPNFVADNFGSEAPPDAVVKFIYDNYVYMVEMSERFAETSEYWTSVKGHLYQLNGLLNGIHASDCLLPADANFEKFPIKPLPRSLQIPPAGDIFNEVEAP